MARKFNAGRQGEYLMNNQLFNAYSSIKYLCNGIDQPLQDKQANIVNGALWVNTGLNRNILERYNSVSNIWEPVFNHYYHPASTTEKPVDPVDGQIWIDLNGIIRYYDSASLQWKVAYANTASEATNTRAALTNFQIMPDLSEITGFTCNYAVPDVSIGRLFDYFETKDAVLNTVTSRNVKIVDDSEYVASNQNVSFHYAPTEDDTRVGLAWVHLNPTFLNNCTKRLIKINKETCFVESTTNNTEFYGFKFGEPAGKFLRNINPNFTKEDISSSDILQDKKSDYVIVSGGIKLINTAVEYDYIYAITYHFAESFSNHMGNLIKGKTTIGTTNQVYIGVIDDDPILFLDGTYQEQATYTYTQNTGVITFSGETITDSMDMLAVSFARIFRDVNNKPLELTITNDNIQDNNIVYTHDRLSTISTFTHPIALVSGIAGHMSYTGITDQVSIENSTITVNNFGPLEDGDSVSIMIVDTGTSYTASGTLSGNAILDSNIKVDKKYLVFIEGLCIGQSEMDISDGKILINGDLSNKEYYLISLNEENDGTYLMFDAPISYYTTQINNKNPNVVYNDASMVLSYVNNDEKNLNGILIDQNHVKVAIDPFTYYVTGQILNVRTENEIGDPYYEYKIYNMDGNYTWQSFEELYGSEDLYKLKDMITQFNGNGSLSIMSNEALEGSNLTYFSYTYADILDEPLIDGNRNCVINIKDHETVETQDFFSTKTQTFFANKGSVSTYVNGIFTIPTDYPSTQCKFTIDTPIATGFVNWKGHDLYPILKDITDETTVDDLNKLNLPEYYFTDDILNQMKRLSKAINQIETTNNLHYIIERTEEGESYAANRVTCSAQDRYEIFDNTYTSSVYIGPGAINIYLNGVLLERKSYSIFDNCNIILNDIQTAGGSDELDREDESTWTLIKYYDKDTGTVKRVHCQEPDVLTIELRSDTSIKKQTYDIKEISYDTQSFDTIDYDFPESLLNTKDLIKIYINGILYDGTYTINKDIITLEDAPLQTNPLVRYLQSHKDIESDYEFSGDRITFEWR